VVVRQVLVVLGLDQVVLVWLLVQVVVDFDVVVMLLYYYVVMIS